MRRIRRETPEGRAKTLLKDAKYRAKIYDIEFDLDEQWILEKLREGICEVTGEVFDFSVTHLEPGRPNPIGPSLDREDPRGGYTKENTRVVTWLYNHAKALGSDEDVKRMAALLIAQPYLNRNYEGED